MTTQQRAATLLLVVAAAALLLSHGAHAARPFDAAMHGQQEHLEAMPDLLLARGNSKGTVKVQLDLYVMSRCPDARRCEERIDEVLATLHPIVDVRTWYIADYKGAAITCKHGEMECQGNKQQLCAWYYSPGESNYDQFWQFVKCQNSNFTAMGTLDLAEDCIREVEFDNGHADKVRACMNGFMGDAFLRQSAAAAEKLGVLKSCTIYIAHHYRCTHDGAQWYDCPGGFETADFVGSICSEYYDQTSTWPDICGDAPSTAQQQALS